MSDTAWLFVAFSAVWIALGVYLMSIAARQRKLETHLREVEGRKLAEEPPPLP
ncbi:MAG TPA: CcmD family protein [Actinomycetota bacterium]|nr:CcmD family protein [Actinomycetota bacterium]